MRSTLFACLALLVVSAAAPAPTLAKVLDATWLVEDGSAKIRFEPCGESVCGRLVWLRVPTDNDTGKPILDKYNPDPGLRSRPLLGLVIFTGLKPAGPGRWKGSVYNADNGNDYEVTVSLDEQSRVEVEGCGLMGLVCQTQKWSRAD